MNEQPKLSVERGAFSSLNEALEQIAAQGLWPTTYISAPSPELPVHWHDCGIQGFLVKGDMYVRDGDGNRVDLSAGDKLVLPPGALHAEGETTGEIIFVVGLEECRSFPHALQMRDPATYPEPELLSLDPAFAEEWFAAIQKAAPPPPPVG